MPNNYSILHGSAAPVWPTYTAKEGAFYYVYTGTNAVSAYGKASALITLPTSIKLRDTIAWSRNAFICLGVTGSEGSIDIGLRNSGRDGVTGEEAPTNQGFGWEAMCYQCGYGNDKPEKIHDERFAAPEGTVRARVTITPDVATKKHITLAVEWLRANNSEIDHFSYTYTLSRTYDFKQFYRFASLPTTNPNASLSDGTFMIGGTFESAYLGNNVNWGINSSTTSTAWIIYPNKCTVPYQWDVGEQFRIEHN